MIAIPQRSLQALLNLLIGAVGAILAGAILAPLLGMGETLGPGFNTPGFITAMLGAVILLTNINVARYLARR